MKADTNFQKKECISGIIFGSKQRLSRRGGGSSSCTMICFNFSMDKNKNCSTHRQNLNKQHEVTVTLAHELAPSHRDVVADWS